MSFKNYYWCFEKALSNKFCNKVIKFGEAQKISSGKIASEIASEKKGKISKKQNKEFRKVRDSKVSFLSHQWLYDEIWPYILSANKNAEWNFEFDWAEPAQFTVYNKGQHYGWHDDSFLSAYNEKQPPQFIGKIRKLSMVCSLSNPRYDSNKYFNVLPPHDAGNNVILWHSFNIRFVSLPAHAK